MTHSTMLWLETESPYKDEKLVHGVFLRNLHPFPGKILNTPPPYWMPYPQIKWTSVKETNYTKRGLLCLWSKPSLCLTASLISSPTLYIFCWLDLNSFLCEAKNSQWVWTLRALDPWMAVSQWKQWPVHRLLYHMLIIVSIMVILTQTATAMRQGQVLFTCISPGPSPAAAYGSDLQLLVPSLCLLMHKDVWGSRTRLKFRRLFPATVKCFDRLLSGNKLKRTGEPPGCSNTNTSHVVP